MLIKVLFLIYFMKLNINLIYTVGRHQVRQQPGPGGAHQVRAGRGPCHQGLGPGRPGRFHATCIRW